jgi:preprotein translocase subunit SecG
MGKNILKKGFTNIDAIHLSIIIFMFIIYLYLVYLVSKNPNSQNNDNNKNQDNNNDPNYAITGIDNPLTLKESNVTVADITCSIWGFILGLFVSSFITRYVFREYGTNITVISTTFIIALIALILYYIVSSYQDKNIDTPIGNYSQIIYPLLGGLFLIAEDSINHFFNYFGGQNNMYNGGFNLNKFAGSLNEIRSTLAKNNLLSDTSTDYIGASSSIFSSESVI